ncbi:MAG: hypothetical protein LKF48_01600 [Prevotella sp.]|jgi:rare lipoprotein A|nr:hypothetical protein [Prevotella sp.]MCH4212068.1 hypothetical protein [Prevotella sp.]MCH4241367.1 hypothetical protein [Prevotella sp.]MCI1742012.1 hypothetical protein [Prevotella sp.]
MIGRGVVTVKVEVVQNPIPFRPTDNLDLPNIDFEVSEAGYSFIEHWKKIKNISKEKNVKKKPKSQRFVSQDQVKGKTTTRQKEITTTNKDEKKPIKRNNTFKKPKESSHKGTSNRWSKAFDN